eukprot:CAMPEP_0113316378 /NCGR_PEP_ID=MMETSP0010_2-20120614/11677_1 /TAXON_ID=216773 ORGANISM="Corethron hystrix, Strain 308" /NCGR_SAMPLE_ID=MMETSP0010_2 /ASSEMBLY_ACC=CAM_ASM_000155 /LENGTH=276 /DNA_ID=CAMNT_0000173081 /DNA_START=164 /DNA_END=990 /DNA_ORIENTATION=- /assembly_acc=CAM_ASM_000155
MSCNALFPIAGQRVLVTGGGRGIGRAIAHIFAREGAQVAICSRTKSELEETAATAVLPSSNLLSSSECVNVCHGMDIYPIDLTEDDQVEDMVLSIVKKWGGIDVLINNAGGKTSKGPAYELSTTDFRDLLNLNVASVHSATSAVLRHSMLKQKSGKIINISSRAGKIGIANMSFYAASKFALEGYSASLAEELKGYNISVNTISPGQVDTKSFPKAPGRKGVRTAESIKDGLLVLLNNDVTGHYLHVDELDQARNEGLEDSVALKSIDEVAFLSLI